MEEAAPGLLHRAPQVTQFKQQKIPGKQPTYSPSYVICLLCTMSLSFLAIGATILVASDGVVEVILQYDDKGTCSIANYTTQEGCASPPLLFDIPRTMKAPVFLYYQVTNFFQNHRKYAKSFSVMQIAGEDPGVLDSDTVPRQTDSLGNVYSPAGLIAWSMFNDSFKLKNAAGFIMYCDGTAFATDATNAPLSKQNCTKKGIAWVTDAADKFGAPFNGSDKILTYSGRPSDPRNYTHILNGWYENENFHKIPNPQDEDFMVWMRPDALSTIRKLYRRIDVDLPEGKYRMDITQRFNVKDFEGTKSFVLMTPGWIGGPNRALAGFYLGVGSITFVFTVTFVLKLFFPTRGDITKG